jgi:hypothetical protein
VGKVTEREKELVEKITRMVTYKMRKRNKTLQSFIDFADKHPELRFWQCLFAWTNKGILVDDEDPFYWKGKNK